MTDDNWRLDELRRLLEVSERAVVFTGAGISTESGIPDFRSPGGVWTKYSPIQYNDYISSEDARRESWRRKFDDSYGFDGAEPNRGHRAVEKLVRDGKVSVVITQNTDGLHLESGVPEEKVVELHGNSTYATCLACGLRHEFEPIRQAFLADGTILDCDACGGLLKAATISFGQPMPDGPMRRAQEETMACDLFLAIGSSLQVYPAAGFPQTAAQNGAALVILNREPTDLDGYADLVLNMEIGHTLGDAVGVN
ncbi:MAG: NAD-dependent deacetylase [Rhodospirillaceae bacterium]|nr:NAD-dependent deacetylase [Rhodospirillaceae bacterium]|tara:strand:- start:21213 stop:21971 length:759 start_codon:yes stop_codon:yes gene_type:complete